jgi:RNA-directed DNA polymerase
MHDDGKSDGLVVPAKLPNNAAYAAAEVVEGRRPAKGNAAGKTRPGLRAGEGVPSALDRVRRKARTDKKGRFTALLHHVDVDRLREGYRAINPRAATGVDGVTWEDYGQDLEDNLRDLHARVQGGSYRARPTRRARRELLRRSAGRRPATARCRHSAHCRSRPAIAESPGEGPQTHRGRALD